MNTVSRGQKLLLVVSLVLAAATLLGHVWLLDWLVSANCQGYFRSLPNSEGWPAYCQQYLADGSAYGATLGTLFIFAFVAFAYGGYRLFAQSPETTSTKMLRSLPLHGVGLMLLYFWYSALTR